MKKWTSIILPIVLLLQFFYLSAFSQSNHVIDEVVFRFAPNVTASEQQTFLDDYNLALIKGPTPVTRFLLCRITSYNNLPLDASGNPINDINGVIISLQSSPSSAINSVGLNMILDAPNSGKSSSPPNCTSNKFSRTIPVGRSSVKTTILDTGIEPDHYELFKPYINLFSPGQNFIGSGHPLDDNGHGTMMTSIIITDELQTIPNLSKLLEVRTHKTYDLLGNGPMYSLIQGIDEAIIERSKIVNISASYFDKYEERFNEYNPLNVAIREAENLEGILFITAAGNSKNNNDNSTNLSAYPASFPRPNIISVASVNCIGQLSSFSGFGRSSVDIAAPGENIVCATLNGNYTNTTGTSAATANVSGIASLLATHQDHFDYAAIKCAILKGATSHSSLKNKVVSNGFINAQAALSYLDFACYNGSNFKTIAPENISMSPILEIKTFLDPMNVQLDIQSSKVQEGQISIYNTQGQLFSQENLFLQEGSNAYTWQQPKKHFSALYFIHIQVGNQSKTLKVMR